MATAPSLILFGPLVSAEPTTESLRHLRSVLKTEPCFAPVLQLLKDPRAFWETVEPACPSVACTTGLDAVTSLSKLLLLRSKGDLDSDTSTFKQNALTLPLTIFFQITAFLAYCRAVGIRSEEFIDATAAQGGIQGCCAGLLSALAVAGGRDATQIGVNTARAIQLAFVIGLLVDADSVQQHAHVSSESVVLAVRCRPGLQYSDLQGIIAAFPRAYIAMKRDERDATVVVPEKDVHDLVNALDEAGVISFNTKLRGRYHSVDHRGLAETIVKHLPSATIPLATSITRSNTTADWLSLDDPTVQVVNCILSETADWYATVSQSLSRCHLGTEVLVLSIGADSVPSSLSKGIKVVPGQAFVDRQSSSPSPDGYSYPEHSVAVVGMSCRFPGAETLGEFWDMLTQGRSMLGRMPKERFDPDSDYPRSAKDMKFWGNFLDDVAGFDHKFFKKSPREAASMDPQQRILLHVAYETLASSGYFAKASLKERKHDIGCYVGACSTDYDHNVMSHAPTAYSTTGTLRAFLSGKISHFFGFSGPSLTLDTACSSSSVAIHTACTALRAGEISAALAGGATIHTSSYLYENLAAAHFLSPTGATKPFDGAADGYCRGEGVGLVMLKRLDDAIRDGDFIRGVIVSSAVNQNSNCVPITVPHSISQADLYQNAAARGRLSNSDLSFVEAHGTGTPVGDPLEIESIRKVFGSSQRRNPLYVTSVKGNIGHLEGASGVAALIKALLQFEHRMVPMQASFKVLNPSIVNLEKDNVCIPTANLPVSDRLLTACVNNYGAAGSNSVLMIVEGPQNQDPADKSVSTTDTVQTRYPVLLTASQPETLERYCRRLSAWLQRQEVLSIDAHTLAVNIERHTNNDLRHALNLNFVDTEDLIVQLSDKDAIKSAVITRTEPKPVIISCGGQVSDRVNISRVLWEMGGPIRTHLDRCDAVLRSKGFPSIYPAIFEDKVITDPVVLHSALFAAQYASAMAWLDSGVEVATVIGHSFGQLTALAICGSLSLEDAVQLIAGRAQIIARRWGPERGTMVLVNADVPTVRDSLHEASREGLHSYEIACYNGPSSNVVVCTQVAAAILEKILVSRSIHHKRLRVPYGFHSKFTEPILDEYLELAKSVLLKSGEIPLETCSESGSWGFPTSQLIVDHTRQPVFFAAAVRRITARLGPCIWLEAGSDSGIISMAHRVVGSDSGHEFVALKLGGSGSLNAVADATSSLWRQGVLFNSWFYHQSARRGTRHLDLPNYAWDYGRHWLELKQNLNPAEDSTTRNNTASQELLTKPPLLRLLSPQEDAGAAEHRLRISLESDEFKDLVRGFNIKASSATWTMLLLEIISRALTLFNINITDFSVQELTAHSPDLGFSAHQDPVLHLGVVGNGWQFLISSLVDGKSKTICDGVLDTRDRRSALVADFARYKRLAGYNVIDRIQSNVHAECLQGNVVYNIFSKAVVVEKEQRVVKSVRALKDEVIGRISTDYDTSAASTRAVDAFLQVAAVHANCLRHNADSHDVYEFLGIQQLSWAPRPISISRDWDVLCSYVESPDEALLTYDLFVYDVHSGALSLFMLGVEFAETMKSPTRTSASSTLAPTPPLVEKSQLEFAPTKILQEQGAGPVKQIKHEVAALSNFDGIFADIGNLLEELAEIGRDQLTLSSTFDSLGVDSLMMMEVIGDLSRLFKVELPLQDLEQLTDIESLINYLDARGCVATGAGEPAVISSLQPFIPSTPLKSDSQDDTQTTAVTPMNSAYLRQATPKQEMVSRELKSPIELFAEIRQTVEAYTIETGFADFWTKVYPSQRDLVLAYVVECFLQLGCDLRCLDYGTTLPEIEVLPKHLHLRARLHEILADGGIIEPRANGSFVRAAKPIGPTLSTERLNTMLANFPQHASESRLVNITGSRLSELMTGKIDPLALLFGNRQNREIMADVYENAPMCKATTRILADYLYRLLLVSCNGKKARILEVGAGTGGTARYVVDFLQRHGIDFEYVFTDISSALVSQGKTKFSAYPQMLFRVFDCDRQPENELKGQFDVVIATNCVHATNNVSNTARNILQVLNEQGVFCLVEFTRPLYWFDLVYGLLDGWWLFGDGRKHALADEAFWYRALTDAGFGYVDWTDGSSPEARTMRLIVSMRQASSGSPMEPVIIKRAGLSVQEVIWGVRAGVELSADIYLPKIIDPPGMKRPIALVFHGGGHPLFGRKDIPMKHVRELLKRGFLPVSVDYRLCPEVGLYEGPYSDCCDALQWAREKLPSCPIAQQLVTPDPGKLISIGWSSGGQLAMSIAFMGPQRGIEPPNAVFALYSPSDLEHEHWSKPCYPAASEEAPQEVFNFLAGVKDHQIVDYAPLNKQRKPSLSLTLDDDRARIVLHMNWKAQTLPVLLRGLPNKAKVQEEGSSSVLSEEQWKYPSPLSLPELQQASPMWHIRNGTYSVPTFMVHGNRDDWLPHTMSEVAKEELRAHGVAAELIVADQCGHAFDLFPAEDPLGHGWTGVEKGYDWICKIIGIS